MEKKRKFSSSVSPAKKKCVLDGFSKEKTNLQFLQKGKWRLIQVLKKSSFTCRCKKTHTELSVLLLNVIDSKIIQLSVGCLKKASLTKNPTLTGANAIAQTIVGILDGKYVDLVPLFTHLVRQGIVEVSDLHFNKPSDNGRFTEKLIPDKSDYDRSKATMKNEFCKWKIVERWYSHPEDYKEKALSAFKIQEDEKEKYKHMIAAEYLLSFKAQETNVSRYGAMYKSLAARKLSQRGFSHAQQKAWDYFKNAENKIDKQSQDYLIWESLIVEKLVGYNKVLSQFYQSRMNIISPEYCYFDFLPNEVVSYIFGFLNFYQVMKCQLVCKRFQNILINHENQRQICVKDYLTQSSVEHNMEQDGINHNALKKIESKIENIFTSNSGSNTLNLRGIKAKRPLYPFDAYKWRNVETLILGAENILYNFEIPSDILYILQQENRLKHLHLIIYKHYAKGLNSIFENCPLLFIEILHIDVFNSYLSFLDIHFSLQLIVTNMHKLRDFSLVMDVSNISFNIEKSEKLENRLLSLEKITWKSLINPIILFGNLPNPGLLKHADFTCEVNHDFLKEISKCVNLEFLHISNKRKIFGSVVKLDEFFNPFNFFPKLRDLAVDLSDKFDLSAEGGNALHLEEMNCFIDSIQKCVKLQHLRIPPSIGLHTMGYSGYLF
jgi:hypothetical protein